MSVSDALIQAGMRAPHAPHIRNPCIQDVVESHDTRGWNYAWLTPYFGKLLWCDHREPAEHITKKKGLPTAEWRTYNSWHWARHGAVVDHNPETLVQEHVAYYVDPDTRSIDLRYYFQLPNGFVYVTFPNRQFYRLERDWFRRHGLCGHASSPKEADHWDSLMQAAYKVHGLATFIPAAKIMAQLMPTPRLALQSVEESIKKLPLKRSQRRRWSRSQR